ncbi:hypothetical protein ADL19_04340 [Streptomyces purpurogeneiscleroticus]|nr:hypothetical protein ADL19_04340 [Streptomyces purpurogeneiscleroticus]
MFDAPRWPAHSGGGCRVSFGRRLMTVTIALLLAAVTVLPLLAEVRHEASGPVANAALSVAEPGQGATHQDADDLIHHAQSHAQGVMPVAAKAPATVAPSAGRSFARADEAFQAGGGLQGPFEPPRA